jgi:hypothetical protein
VIEATGSNFYMGGIAPTHQVRQPAVVQAPAPVEDPADAALEDFLASWTSGTAGSDLDSMVALQQKVNPEMPDAAQVKPKEEPASDDRFVKEIEFLARRHGDLFKNHGGLGTVSDGWNIAGA